VLASYLLVTLALVLTPGASTAVVVRNTLAGGRATGFATAAGIALGNVLQATITGVGLAMLLARWPTAFDIIRIVGGLYLAWLGLVSVWRVITRVDGGVPAPSTGDAAASDRGRRSLVQGLTVNLLNPSITTFYLVVVPSFLPPAASRWYFAGLAALHVGLALACHTIWIVALDRVRRFFRHPMARRSLEAVSGIALIGLAARVLL
jgi:threonine/homoserine/homoserine lactone efflux protein